MRESSGGSDRRGLRSPRCAVAAVAVCVGLFVVPQAFAATFEVNTSSSGIHPGATCATGANPGTDPCSLDDAIAAANTVSGSDAITFASASAPYLIKPTAALPLITSTVIVDGGAPGKVQLDGTATSALYGLDFESGAIASTVMHISVTGWNRGNGAGIKIGAGSSVTVSGSMIGTDWNETSTTVGNYGGVEVDGTATIDASQGQNTFSGNTTGIALFGAATVQGSFFGPAGGASGNGIQAILVQSGSPAIQIGGTGGGQFNQITGNGAGIEVLTPSKAQITQNLIHGNTGGGIAFNHDGGHTGNDSPDVDGVPNRPVITSAFTNGTNVQVAGTLSSAANAHYTIELFSGATCDSTGGGDTYLGNLTVDTDLGGSGTFSGTVANTSGVVVATATGPSGTSEFSACATISSNSPQTFTVVDAGDASHGACNPGTCTLRDAVAAANAHVGADEIDFHLAASGAQTILLDPTANPTPIQITDPVTIDGTTEPGGYGLFPVGVDIAADVGALGQVNDGLELAGGSDGSTVRGLGFSGFSAAGAVSAIQIDSNNNTIVGNLFGAVVDSGPTFDGVGIAITGSNNVVGGSGAGDANLFVDVGDGVVVQAAAVPAPAPDGNRIVGNRFGFQPDGATPGSLGTGIRLVGATDTVIGSDVTPDQLAEVDPSLANLFGGATTAALLVDMGTTGTRIAGNYIGTTASGDSSDNPNAAGILVSNGSSNNQLGPGNDIAYNGGFGIRIDGSTGVSAVPAAGNRIVANSIHDNDGLGIELLNGGNDGIAAPVITGVTNGVASGTVAGSSGTTFFVELFGNPTCSGGDATSGRTYLIFVPVTIPNGKSQTSWSTPAPVNVGDGLTVTSTNGTGPSDTSEFSNCALAQQAGAGTLTGTLSTVAPSKPVDLTASGNEDWAVWGYAANGTSTSLSPDVRKAGASAISPLTDIAPVQAPRRGIGQFGSLTPFKFNWSNGSGNTPAATGAATGIQHDGGPPVNVDPVGDGFSFSVPAGTSPRTLTVYASAHFGDGVLTASLSDDSAQPYAQPVSCPGCTNGPGVYTIEYAAASAGQTLDVQFVESTGQCGSFCDNVAIYAVTLSDTTASLTGAASVKASGSNDQINALPLDAFAPARSDVSPQPINGLPINALPINGLPINGLPINALPINGLPINGLPINALPINGLPINGLPINGLPINGLPINGLPINGLPINGLTINGQPANWTTILAGTALAGKPLQTITLQDVLKLNPQPAAVARLTIGDLSLGGDSDLGDVTIGALALGSTPINALALSAEVLQQLVTWCKSIDTSPANCTTTSVGNTSLFSLGLAGAPIKAADQRPADQCAADQRPPDQCAPDQRPADQRPVPGGVADQRPADQCAPDQRPSDQRARRHEIRRLRLLEGRLRDGDARRRREDRGCDQAGCHRRPASQPAAGDGQPGEDDPDPRRPRVARDRHRQHALGEVVAAAPRRVRPEPSDHPADRGLQGGRKRARRRRRQGRTAAGVRLRRGNVQPDGGQRGAVQPRRSAPHRRPVRNR